MTENKKVVLSRDVEAIRVPTGEQVVLAKGEEASIFQELGNNYTIIVQGNMFMIEGKNADAIGEQVKEKPSSQCPPTQNRQLTQEEIEKKVWEALKNCYDPEIPVNIVELGLVYDCKVEPLKDGGFKVNVKMTLTAPGCAMGPMIAQDVQNKLISIDGVNEANVELVWEPTWSQEMMSESAKLQLGFL